MARIYAPILALFALALAQAVHAQTAGPKPTYVYTYQDGTGSVNPSLVNAASTAAESYRDILASSGADTATNVIAPFATTSTQGVITPTGYATSFGYTSLGPGIVESSNTRGAFQTNGNVDTKLPVAASSGPGGIGKAANLLPPNVDMIAKAMAAVFGVAGVAGFLVL